MELVSLNSAPTEMTELERAKADMDFARRKGGFAYKQAKRHYERLRRKNGWKSS